MLESEIADGVLSLDMLRPKEIIFKNRKLSRQTSKFRWHWLELEEFVKEKDSLG